MIIEAVSSCNFISKEKGRAVEELKIM